MAIILLACRPCVVIVEYWDRLYFGRAPRTKETLPDFREWCRVTRHSRVFRGLTGCQRTPDFGASQYVRNKARLEGSFAEAYTVNEALTFCSMYLRGIETRFNRGERNEDRFENQAQGCISIFS